MASEQLCDTGWTDCVEHDVWYENSWDLPAGTAALTPRRDECPKNFPENHSAFMENETNRDKVLVIQRMFNGTRFLSAFLVFRSRHEGVAQLVEQRTFNP